MPAGALLGQALGWRAAFWAVALISLPAMLALFGLGSFAGVTIGGRLSDTRPMRVLIPGGIALLAGWVLFTATAHSPIATFLLVFVQGTLSFAVGSTLIAQVLYAATQAPSLGGSFATAALNVGAAVGPAIGGATIAAGLGYRSPLWVSALLVAAALVTAGLAQVIQRLRSTPREETLPKPSRSKTMRSPPGSTRTRSPPPSQMHDQTSDDGKRAYTVRQIADKIGVKRTTLNGYLRVTSPKGTHG
ncbi:MFS transporter [Streptosporangium subroseum]